MTKDEAIDEIINEVGDRLDGKKKPPLCKDCKYCDMSVFSKVLFALGFHPGLVNVRCLAKEAIVSNESTNPLNGKVTPVSNNYCRSMREFKCKEGKLFERRV